MTAAMTAFTAIARIATLFLAFSALLRSFGGTTHAFVHPRPYNSLQVLLAVDGLKNGAIALDGVDNGDNLRKDQTTRFLIGNGPSAVFVQNSEYSSKVDRKEKWFALADHAAASVFIGTILTFVLNNNLSLGPLRASCSVGLLAAIILSERLALAAFLGSFAGMARVQVIPSIPAAFVLGLLSASFLTLFDKKKWLTGMGGRLGFIAQLSCTTQYLVTRAFLQPVHGGGALIGKYTLSMVTQIIPVCIATVTGAFLMSAWKAATLYLMNSQQIKGIWRTILPQLSTSVAAASVTGILISSFAGSFGGPAYCGAFVAMSSPERLRTYGDLLGASLCAGLSQIILTGTMTGGWSGKLGTAALMGVVMFRAATAFLKKTRREQLIKQT